MDGMTFVVEVLKYTSPVLIALIAASKKNAHPHKRSSQSTHKRER